MPLTRRALLPLAFLAVTACGGTGTPVALLTDAEVAVVDSLLADTTIAPVDKLGYPVELLDRREVSRLLLAAQYDSLEAILEDRWQATRADIRNENRLYHLFEGFYQSNAMIQPALAAWSAARPASANAKVAEAYYRYGRAVEARGEGSAGQTGSARFGEMRYHIGVGKSAVREALHRDPDHLIAHFVRLNYLRLGGDDPDSARAIVGGALTSHPASYLIRNDILALLEPRWGGSIEIMKDFVASGEGFYEANPRLRVLQGAVPRAEARLQHDDPGMALALLDQANSFGEDYFLALSYAEFYQHAGRFVDALRASNRARAMMPQGRSNLEDRVWLLTRIGGRIADERVRERTWLEAERTLRVMRDLRIPSTNIPMAYATVQGGRSSCRVKPAPC
jgi:tetratricopeptide (TPR) repeat protein